MKVNSLLIDLPFFFFGMIRLIVREIWLYGFFFGFLMPCLSVPVCENRHDLSGLSLNIGSDFYLVLQLILDRSFLERFKIALPWSFMLQNSLKSYFLPSVHYTCTRLHLY